MDAFFASVEQLDDPSLRGKPVLVGGAGKRGVVAAASYEARKFGCRSAMPTAMALRRCPHAIILPGRFSRYSEVSSRVFGILGDFSPVIEPLSVDEAFVDVSGTHAVQGDGPTIARAIRARVRDELGLTVSVGVATNKMVAKVASDVDKPDGLTVVEPGTEAAFLAPRSVAVIPGLGPASVRRLNAIGLRTVGELASAPIDQLRPIFGEHAERVHRKALGLDDRPVRTDRECKSISQERTMTDDLATPEQGRALLLWHVENVAHRLRSKGLVAGGLTLKLRFGDFETLTRSASIKPATSRTDELWRVAQQVYERWVGEGWQPLRLLGFGVDRLTEAGTQSIGLFEQEQQASPLDAAKDAVIDRFGKHAITPAGALSRRRKDR